MARRPVFITLKKAPFVDVFTPEFQWNSGFSATQKQKTLSPCTRRIAKGFRIVKFWRFPLNPCRT